MFSLKNHPFAVETFFNTSLVLTYAVAKEELKKSLALDKEFGYGEGMIQDYYDLARLTAEWESVTDTVNAPQG